MADRNILKVTLIGDATTGKSSIYNKYTNLHNPSYRFNKRYRATSEFNMKPINLDTTEGNVLVQLWDTAGQENSIEGLRDSYLKGSDCVIVMYDIFNKKSIENLNKWATDVKKLCGNIPVAVVGNKIDKIKNINNLDKDILHYDVKLRKSSLKSQFRVDYLETFLISVKSDRMLVEGNYFTSNKLEKKGSIKPLEYVISKHLGKDTKLTDFLNKKKK